MDERESTIVFDEERAAAYERRFAKLAPMRDGLHLLLRLVLAELPEQAHILCVGAGTGAELFYLANAFPRWRFTAVDPASPMLAICRQRAQAAGVARRCHFHEGSLDSLPGTQRFDAATSILVSQFILQQDRRREFFADIAARLRPGACLVSADLALTADRDRLRDNWRQALTYSGMSDEEIDAYWQSWQQGVAVLPAAEVAAIIAAAGFETPVLFFQSLLMHAWYARPSQGAGRKMPGRHFAGPSQAE